MFSFFSKKKANGQGQSLEKGISKVEVYLAYGLPKKADELLQTLLSANPGNVQLLALQEKASKL